MKDNLEKAFKEKLDQFEAPYDASAWEAMNSRLDAQQGAGGSSVLKWIAGTAAVITVVSLAIYYGSDQTSETTLKADTKIEERVNSADNNTPVQSDSEVNGPEEVGIQEEVQHLGNIDHSNETEDVQQENIVTQEVNDPSHEENNESNVSSNNEDDSTPNVQNQVINSKLPEYKFIPGKLSNEKICKGESITITNNGAKNAVIKLQLNDEVVSLKKAHTHEFSPEHSGTVYFLDGKNNVIDRASFSVMENPTPEFNLKANIYDKGLPVTNCETYGDYELTVWSFDGENEQSGRKVTHNFFKKGDHKVSLKVKDFNGCENTLTKTVRIEEDYNLMAVDAFTPNDADPRNKVFMPFALTQRDVKFVLTIVDPRDNSVVFTSQDATKGWDGHDQRTGKMTPSETAYIWKVQLESSIPHERKVYAGTVVHN